VNLLKSCGHCLGDMFMEKFLGDRELVCLQCGNRMRPPAMALAPVPVVAGLGSRISGRPPRRWLAGRRSGG
jgi:hypothetical protein